MVAGDSGCHQRWHRRKAHIARGTAPPGASLQSPLHFTLPSCKHSSAPCASDSGKLSGGSAAAARSERGAPGSPGPARRGPAQQQQAVTMAALDDDSKGKLLRQVRGGGAWRLRPARGSSEQPAPLGPQGRSRRDAMTRGHPPTAAGAAGGVPSSSPLISPPASPSPGPPGGVLLQRQQPAQGQLPQGRGGEAPQRM